MTFSTNEDWKQVGNFIKDFPGNVFGKEARHTRQTKLNSLSKQEITPEQLEETKNWIEKLKQYAEQGRHRLEKTLLDPDASILKQIQGDESGDPLVLILKRTIGHLGKGIYKVLYVILNKILHLPDMYKFFTHDALQVGKDFIHGSWELLKHPTQGSSWKDFWQHFLNLIRLPVAAFMMGIGAKFTYQQYQLIHSLGFTQVDLASVGAANAILCWFLFLCFLFPKWFEDTEHAALRALASILKSLFPQQMYKKEEIDTDMDDLQFLCEDVSRYSIEVNYRSSKKEILDAWAKLVLGFVSASLQREGYHVKHVYSEKPLRILVSSNNWDDGSWTAILCYNHQYEYFVVSSGFWNKDRKTVSIQRDTGKCAEETASGLVTKMLNFMHDVKKRDPRKINTLKPVPMKRGPKK